MPLRRRFVSPISLLIPVLLTGCAAGGSYPSLLPRPAEQEGAAQAAAPPVAPAVAADPGLNARITQLFAQAQDGQRQFEIALTPARASVTRAGAAGSESWIGAQQAVSRLENARTPTVNALAELDSMARSRAEAGIATAAADLAAIASAEDQVRAIADAQEQEIGRLGSALPQP